MYDFLRAAGLEEGCDWDGRFEHFVLGDDLFVVFSGDEWFLVDAAELEEGYEEGYFDR